MMKILTLRAPSWFFRFTAFFSVAAALLFSAPQASAALITTTTGSATTTITTAVFHSDVLISIEAVQSGYLSNIGAFTANFSYTALVTANGNRLYLQASILELGLDYPRTLNGALTIIGGTGRFAGATGTLLINGMDEESLTDTIQIQGAIITPGALLGGLLK
jgi:hypothetical protein